jgi:NAD(P)-dependent dehydrogenase (short-subunit alcohol dehydrogenase family)
MPERKIELIGKGFTRNEVERGLMDMEKMNAGSLEGQVALVTGGATGLGMGIAQTFVAQGARVVLCSRNEAQLKEAADELGANTTYRRHDVTDFDAAEGLVAEIEASVGPVSILVNNAGVHQKKPSETVTTEEFQQVLNVHVLGAHALTTAVGKRMLQRKSGSILFIASMASLFGIPYVLAYSTAKAGYLGMVRNLATEWGPTGVRVNAIAPGWIESAMTRKALDSDPARKNKILGRTPLGCLGDPKDIGEAAAFLCSPAAKFITGVCLPVHGGASIGF